MIINLLAEGYTEEVVAMQLLPFCGHELGTVYGKCGCTFIQRKAAEFRHLATEKTGVLILTDFRDAKTDCIPEALHKYVLNRLTDLPNNFLCRFSVNEIESWLLADREGLAEYLNIALSRMPLQPECETYPKQTLVNLARKSTKKIIREGIAPPSGHRAAVGPEYSNFICEFILKYWDIENAIRCAPSLERCVRRLKEIV